MNIGDKKLSIITTRKGINIQLFDENGESDFDLELLPDQAFEFVMELMNALYKTGYKKIN